MTLERKHRLRLPEGHPIKGWIWESVEDNETPNFTCEACFYPSVRYVHTLSHPTIAEPLYTGCICAASLTEIDEVELKAREAEVRNKTKRRKRWEDGWRMSRKGNLFKKTKEGNLVVLYRKSSLSSLWGIIINEDKPSGWYSLKEAQDASFKLLYGA